MEKRAFAKDVCIVDSISKSIAETIKKRAASTALATYTFFWCSYHWQGIFVTFFVKEELIYKKFNLLKNEYVNNYFFGLHGWNDWGFYLGFILPAIFTYIFIWWIPKIILLSAYKQEQRYKVDKRIIRNEEERRLQINEEHLATQETKTVEAKIEASEIKNKASEIDPTILWEQDYIKLNNNKKNYLKDILECIYKHRGYIEVGSEYVGGYPMFELNPNSLKFADSLNLIEIVDKGNRIALTDKGKYFAKKYEGVI